MNDEMIATKINWMLQDILQIQIGGKLAAWNLTLLVDLGNGKVNFLTLVVPPACFGGDTNDEK